MTTRRTTESLISRAPMRGAVRCRFAAQFLSGLLWAGSALAQAPSPQQSTSGPEPPPEAGPKADWTTTQPGIQAEDAYRVIAGVPGYAWRHGCGPTAVGMVMGYYDGQGFPDLFLGDARTQTGDVNQGIASQGSGTRGTGVQLHYEDYSLPNDASSQAILADRSATYPYGCHLDNSIADFMHTSWSKDGNKYGWSWSSKVIPAFTSYVKLRNPAYRAQCGGYTMGSSLTWGVLVSEILNNRPMVFLVDSNGDGKTDHFVTVIGYSSSLEYGCLDTWYPYTRIRWCQFRGMSSSYSWGVWGGWSFRLSSLNRPPIANAGTNQVVECAGGVTPVLLDGTGSRDPDGDPVAFEWREGDTLAGTNRLQPVLLSLGAHHFTLKVTDSGKLSAWCSNTVTVVDTTPPTITCPADRVATNAHDRWTSVVNFSSAAFDECSGEGLPVCTPASGSAFDLGTTVVTCSATDAAGNSNQCSFTVTVHPGNQPPVPVIEVSPQARFPGRTNLLVLAPDNRSALVAFDASQSFDPDDGSFSYFWYDGTNLFATNAVTLHRLGAGAHEITLRLDDTFPLGTNTASVTVEVISLSDAVAIVADLVKDSDLPSPGQQPLLATLKAARASFERGNMGSGINQLEAFENKTRAQVAPDDPVLAEQLIQSAQEIIDILSGDGDKAPAKIMRITFQANGRVRMHFQPKRGRILVVETSTDLATWKQISMVAEDGKGWIEFEDSDAPRTRARFYRIVSP